MVTSVNGVAYIAAPAVGVLLYGMWMPLPFVATAAMLLILAIWVRLRVGSLKEARTSAIETADSPDCENRNR